VGIVACPGPVGRVIGLSDHSQPRADLGID